MAQNQALPDGWTLVGGDIGTDLILDTTYTVNGSYSLKFPTGGADVALYSQWVPAQTGGDVATLVINYGEAYASLSASSTAASDDVLVEVETTDDFATITSTTIFNSNLSTTSFQDYGKTFDWTGETWVRLKISRPTDRDFDLWVGRAYLTHVPPLRATDSTPSSAQAFPTSWTTAAVFSAGWTVNFSDDSQAAITAGGLMQPGIPGVYIATATIWLADNLEDGDLFGIRLIRTSDSQVFGATSLGIPVAYNATSSANYVPLGVTSLPIRLDARDTVEVQIRQFTNTGTPKDWNQIYGGLVKATAER